MKARFLFTLFVIACGGAPVSSPPKAASTPAPLPASEPAPAQTPDAPFRANPPDPTGGITWAPPKFATETLPNGLRLYVLEEPSFPIVSVRVVSRVGAGDLASAKPGVAGFVGAMLEQGTERNTALEISDLYEELGAVHGASFDWDSASVYAKVERKHLEKVLSLHADIVRRAAFSKDEVLRVRERRLGALKSEAANPQAIAQRALARSFFGDAHPYGHALLGREADIRDVREADLRAVYRETFSPDRVAVVLAGQVTLDEARTLALRYFGDWKKGPPGKPATPKPPASKRAVVLVHRPGPQAQVSVVDVGLSRRDKDYDAALVTNHILGGAFSSRINMNLREAHGYAYGAYSRVAERHHVGAFFAGGSIKAEHAVDAVRELLSEVGKMGDGVSDEELRGAHDHLSLSLPARFEGVDGAGGALAHLFVHGLAEDEYATFEKRIRAVTKADVARMTKRLFDPSRMRIVVVGDRDALRGPLSEWGPVEERSTVGDLIPSDKKK